jgi:hypothetical protein
VAPGTDPFSFVGLPLAGRPCLPQPGEAGTKNFAEKSESRNSKSETTKTGRAKRSTPDAGGLNYFRVRIFTLFRNV